jgi:hypothetical protein
MNKEASKSYSKCHLEIEHWLQNIEDTSHSNNSDDLKEIIFSPRKKPVFPRNDNLTDVEKEIKSVDETKENTTSSK